MANALTLDASWKWLPKTALFVQLSQGYIILLQHRRPAIRSRSRYPLHAMAGIRGLITAKLAVNLIGRVHERLLRDPAPGPSRVPRQFQRGRRRHLPPDAVDDVTLGYRHDFQNADPRRLLLSGCRLPECGPGHRGAAGLGSFGSLREPLVPGRSADQRHRMHDQPSR